MYVLSASTRPELIRATLGTLHAFLSWIPLGYIFESTLVQSCSSSVAEDQPAFRRSVLHAAPVLWHTDFPLAVCLAQCLTQHKWSFAPSRKRLAHERFMQLDMQKKDLIVTLRAAWTVSAEAGLC